MTSPYEEDEAQKRQQADQAPAIAFRFVGALVGMLGGGLVARQFELPQFVPYLIAGLLGGLGVLIGNQLTHWMNSDERWEKMIAAEQAAKEKDSK